MARTSSAAREPRSRANAASSSMSRPYSVTVRGDARRSPARWRRNAASDSSIVTFLRYHGAGARGQLRGQYPQVATLGPASEVAGNVAHAVLAHCWHAAQSVGPAHAAVIRHCPGPVVELQCDPVGQAGTVESVVSQ